MSGLGILHIMKVNDEPSDLCARALATVVGNQDPKQLALKMYVVVGTYSRVALQSHCWEAKWNNVQHGVNWVCLKMLCTPLYPMVLLIIIPFLNGYFIGKINPTFSVTNPICC